MLVSKLLPLKSIEIGIEESSCGDSQPEQDRTSQVQCGVEAGGARVQLHKSNSRFAIFVFYGILKKKQIKTIFLAKCVITILQ